MKTKRTKRIYLVGYDGDHQTLYGKDINEFGKAGYVDPLTLQQANQKLKELADDGRAIYKIVRVK